MLSVVLTIELTGLVLGINRLPKQISGFVNKGTRAQISKMSRPSVFGENCSSEILFLLFHELQYPFVFIFGQPIAVAVLAVIHFKVVKSILKSPQGFAALGAFRSCGGGTEHQTALFVVAKIKHFIFELLTSLVI
jgi:hypothetical protein